jgi:hypothetical protein
VPPDELVDGRPDGARLMGLRLLGQEIGEMHVPSLGDDEGQSPMQ